MSGFQRVLTVAQGYIGYFQKRKKARMVQKYQGFPRDFSRCEHPAGFHERRDNPVIPWNFEIPFPSKLMPWKCLRSRSCPVLFYEIPIPCKLVPWKFGQIPWNPCPVPCKPVKFEVSQSHSNQSCGFVVPRDLSREISDTTGLSRDFWCIAQRLDVLNSKQEVMLSNLACNICFLNVLHFLFSI